MLLDRGPKKGPSSGGGARRLPYVEPPSSVPPPAADACPACSAGAPRALGELPPCRGVLGQRPGGWLLHCPSCGLFFRWPYVEDADARDAYAALPASLWQYTPGSRRDWQIAARFVEGRQQCHAVLDIGCFTGGFLSLLPDRVARCGVEPCQAARDVAASRGVELIGCCFDDLRRSDRRFGVVTAFDVVEHVRDPLSLLRTAAGVTEPGGLIILSTGDADGLTFRLSRLDHYYYMSEHVSFVGLRWFRWAANALGLRVRHTAHFAHSRQPVTRTATALVKCLTYSATRLTQKWPRAYRYLAVAWPFSRAARWERAPAVRGWPDHVLVVFEKPFRPA